MATIKSLDRIKTNWQSGTATAQPRYKDGVENPRTPWKDATIAAAPLQKQAMLDALNRDAVLKGVQATAPDKQKIRASTLGPSRYSAGAAAAVNDYGIGFAPYREVISGVVLAPRGPKGSPENYQRVQAIGDALHQKKIA
jgi:hypothetical protein